LLDLFFPRRCLGCGSEGAWLCGACRQKTVSAQLYTHPEYCSVQGLLSFGQPEVRELLHHLKYNGIYEAASSLVDLVQWHYSPKALVELLGPSIVLIPVPISRTRAKLRGYNQVQLLVNELAEWLQAPVWLGLERRDRSASQVGKTVEERQGIKKFVCETELPEEYSEHQLVVVDDVLTTGSTLRQCQQVLEAATGKDVRGLAVAYQK